MSRAALSAIVELLESSHIADVQRALARLDERDDPELWRALAPSFQRRAWKNESWQTARGPVTGRLPWADQIGLAIRARVGMGDGPNRILVEGYWELSPLRRLTDLLDLSLVRCVQPTDVTPLRHLVGLQRLSLHDNAGLDDLGPLGRLSELHTLVLWGCPRIVDLAPLQGLPRLYHLHLDDCPALADLSPLRTMTSLEELSLERCPALADLSPLLELPSLKYLDLFGSPEELSGLDRLRQRPGLDVRA